MKSSICFSLILLLSFASKAQNIRVDSTLRSVSHRLSIVLKDSLSLNAGQFAQIEKINLDLAKEQNMFFTVSKDPEFLQREIQKVENTRDYRYSKVFTPEQFRRYKISKHRLMRY